MRKAAWLILASLALPLEFAAAQSAEEKGLEIAREMDRRDVGWGDQRANMQMTLRNKHGQESTRQIRTFSLEVEGDGDKAMTVFDSPRDVKGTAFLSFTHALKPDDQWLYLPALKRVKRIASANKSGKFMGSEFAYEDLTSQEVAKYSYKWLRDEELGGRKTMVMERYPEYEHSGYTRQVVWVDAQMWQPVKVDYFDRKDAPLKTLTFDGYRQYADKYWRAARMAMVNHQTGKSTDLVWTGYTFGTGLSDKDFNKNALKRAR